MGRTRAKRDEVRLASILKQARLDAGLRQRDVAERLDQPQSFVSKYESAERSLTLVELRAVCAAIGTPLVDIVQQLEQQA
jgi:transcriptional regulator with XRE-family HTH domain